MLGLLQQQQSLCGVGGGCETMQTGGHCCSLSNILGPQKDLFWRKIFENIYTYNTQHILMLLVSHKTTSNLACSDPRLETEKYIAIIFP